MRLHAVGLVVTLAVALLVAPLAAEAQQQTKVYRIGLLTALPRPSQPSPAVEAFRQGLHDLGYVEGKNLVIESRYAEHQLDRLPILAAELVGVQPDVIFTFGTPGILAARQATTTIPIVVASGGDLVAQGIIASFARPGGNITGLTLVGLNSKRLELLKEAVPTVTRVALLFNPANPANPFAGGDIEADGRALGVQVQRIEVHHPDALDTAFLAIAAGGADALLLHDDPVLTTQTRRIAEFALQHQLPTMVPGRHQAQAGALIAYEAHPTDRFRRAAAYVDKILKGANPADLPVERADRLILVVNLKTAETLGVTLPPTFLFRADELIK
jgi:putative ABC transport system substrate-binding protein